MAWSLELCSECWAIKTGRKLLPQAPARCPRFNSWQAPSNPFSALRRLRMHAGHDGVCRYVHQSSTTYAASNSKGSRTKGVVTLGRSCRMSSCKPNVYKVDRRVWAVPVQWAAATGQVVADLGKKRSRNQGIEWKRLDPGAGDHPPSPIHQAATGCSTTAKR